MRPERCARLRARSRHLLLLEELLIWMMAAGAVVAAWHYGLLQEVWRSDRTGLALGVTLVFAGTALRGSWHVLRLSRALIHIGDLEQYVSRHGFAAFRNETESPEPHPDLPKGCIAEHVRHLQRKAEIGGSGSIDQALLLDALEADLRRGQELGWFVADLLLSLGLLGAVIGFILMLGPVGGVVATDESAITGALAAMRGGMAVVLYVTSAGLVGGLLLKLQCFLMDGAVRQLVGRTIRLTEAFVLPALERRQLPPASERMRPDAAA